jgi:hypothetical protein
MVEFTLYGIPAVFLLISIVEISRGMWTYHNLNYGLNVGARYVSLHGSGCTTSPYSCGIKVQDVANRIASATMGIPSDAMNVTLTSNAGSKPCNPLSSCQTDTTAWPPASANAPGNEILITGTYTFRSALSMFFPGSSPVQFAVTKLNASSRQVIQW